MRAGLKEILAIVFWVVLTTFAFVFYTPESVRILFDQWGLQTVPEMVDTPTLFAVMILLNPLFIIFQYAIIYLRKTSSIIIGEGMDSPESCDSSDLRNQMNADFAFIKVGGTKDIPIKGPHVWLNPLTHIYRYGDHLLFGGKMTPNTEITNTPFGIKRDIRARRYSDFFELKDASIGFFTPNERAKNVRFCKADTNEQIDTNTFLERLLLLNRNYDVELQQNEGENYSVSKNLKSHADTGNVFKSVQKKGMLEQIGLVGTK